MKSVGRGATLLLNVPPDRRGKFHANDSTALVGFKKLRQESFQMNLLRNSNSYYQQSKTLKKIPALVDENSTTTVTMTTVEGHSFLIDLKENKKINCIVLLEDLKKGQSCTKYRLYLLDKNHQILKEIKGTTIGRKRIFTFSAIEKVSRINLTIDEQIKPTVIAEIKAYYIDEALTEM